MLELSGSSNSGHGLAALFNHAYAGLAAQFCDGILRAADHRGPASYFLMTMSSSFSGSRAAAATLANRVIIAKGGASIIDIHQ
jgi:hypothetical protein